MSLEQDADDWFARMRGPDADKEREAFDAWLAVPAHARAYDRRARSFDTTMFLTNTPTGRNRSLDIAKPRPFRTTVWAFVAAAAGIFLIGVLVIIGGHRYFVDQKILSRMEVASLDEAPRRIQLPDGSVVVLDRGARMQVAFNEGERRLRLLTGKARFEVAHENTRPFIVEAGLGRVIAHGTIFDVELMPSAVRVALLQGAVEVQEGTGRGRHKSVKLDAGYRVAVSDGAVSGPSKIEDSERIWTEDMLVLDGVDIEKAIAAFNRTAPVPVIYELPQARPMKVTGIFKRSDSHAFADQLAGAFGLAVDERADGSLALVERLQAEKRAMP